LVFALKFSVFNWFDKKDRISKIQPHKLQEHQFGDSLRHRDQYSNKTKRNFMFYIIFVIVARLIWIKWHMYILYKMHNFLFSLISFPFPFVYI